ncbi:MAG: HAD family hydrolase [Enterococcus sp.]
MKINAVIFDMDGLLFDTEMVYYQATQIVADAMSFPYDKELYLRFLGVSDEEVWANYHELFADFGQETVQKFIDASYQKTLELFSSGTVSLKPGVLELLDFLDEQAIPRVIASSNNRQVIDMLLEKNALMDRFHGIVSAENVQRAKPDPEIFLLAQQKLGTVKEQTLILEDSQNGIIAANRAEIPVIMVPDLMPPSDTLRERTVAVLDSLIDLPTFLK